MHDKIIHVTSYPPRQCGIATFTQDLALAIDNLFQPTIQSHIIALNDAVATQYRYSKKVLTEIMQHDLASYQAAAKWVNQQPTIRLVNIQHEFGLFGGEYGDYILHFLNALEKPAVITFHTVLSKPSPALKNIVRSLADKVKKIIVMTESAKKILYQDYQLSENLICVIPHGIHPWPYFTTKKRKKQFGYEDRTVLSTFGFLSRNKGLEYVIRALPEVIKEHPNIIYCVFGITHPNVLKHEGESYRNTLQEEIKTLGLTKHVKFYNEYLKLSDLLKFLEMTDLYISTGLNMEQAVSGTLSYALGMGKPVISTAFKQAQELLTPDIGLLLPPEQPSEFTKAILKLLKEPRLLLDFGKNAYFKTRTMTWPNVALQYATVYAECHPELQIQQRRKRLPPIKLTHLKNLTDHFGILQFAKFSIPDPASGYTLDDNARALLVLGRYYQIHQQNLTDAAEKKKLLQMMDLYLNFIEHMQNENGQFKNYIHYDQSWNDEANRQENLEDANGRALYTLSFITATSIFPESFRKKSRTMLKKAFISNIQLNSPRAIAFFVKGLYWLILKKQFFDGVDLVESMKKHCNLLLSLYHAHHEADWHWFEPILTYANALLSEALFLGYRTTHEEIYLTVAEKTLAFLIQVHFDENQQYAPIGQTDWYVKSGARSQFDQQPEDVTAMIQALHTAYQVTQKSKYRELMRSAFNWFLGDNALHQTIYNEVTGGCYDGLQRTGVNLNQGAESTISYLIARLMLETN